MAARGLILLSGWLLALPVWAHSDGLGEFAPDPTVVYGSADLATIPAETSAIQLDNDYSGDLAGLTRCPLLRSLDVGFVCSSLSLASLDKSPSLEILDLSQHRDLKDSEIDIISKLSRLRKLGFQDNKHLTESSLQALAKLASLESFKLTHNEHSVESWASILGQLPHLTELSLADSPNFSAPEFGKLLAALPRLRKLHLGERGLNDASIDEMAKLPALTELDLDLEWARVPDAGLVRIGKLPGLERLSLRMDDSAGLAGTLAKLAELPSLPLTGLDLSCRYSCYDKGLSDPVMEQVAKLAKLERVDLANRPELTDAALRHVMGLANLEQLNLNHCPKLSGPGLAALAALQKLRVLRIAGSQITDAGVEQLAKLPALEWLDLDHCAAVTDRALEALSESKSFRGVRLYGTSVTPEGVQKLRLARPGSFIDAPGADVPLRDVQPCTSYRGTLGGTRKLQMQLSIQGSQVTGTVSFEPKPSEKPATRTSEAEGDRDEDAEEPADEEGIEEDSEEPADEEGIDVVNVDGSVDAEGKLVLAAFAEDEVATGTFQGRFVASEAFEGEWSSAGESETLSFRVAASNESCDRLSRLEGRYPGGGEDCFQLSRVNATHADFSFVTTQNDDFSCSMSGRAVLNGGVLEYREFLEDSAQECRLQIRISPGYVELKDPSNKCRQQYCGARAGIDEISFSLFRKAPENTKCTD